MSPRVNLERDNRVEAQLQIGPELLQALIVAVSAALTENILLTKFLGMCPFLSISRQVKTTMGLGWAVVFVLTGTAILNWVLYEYVLVPLELEFLRFIMFIIMIAAQIPEQRREILLSARRLANGSCRIPIRVPLLIAWDIGAQRR